MDDLDKIIKRLGTGATPTARARRIPAGKRMYREETMQKIMDRKAFHKAMKGK